MAGPMHTYQMGGAVSVPGIPSASGMPPAYQPMVGQQPSPMPGHQPQVIVSPRKEVNALTICRLGQETVQEVVQKIFEIFNLLQAGKGIPLPTGVNPSSQIYQDRRTKLEDNIKQLNNNMDRLRMIYDRLNESGDIGDLPDESSIPIVGQPHIKPQTSDVYHYVSEEHKDLVEKVRCKNKQLKAVVDQMRTILWEINTMIIMRKT